MNVLTLSELRARAGLSRLRLALLVGVSESTVWRWERGRGHPGIGSLRGLAGALQVRLEVVVAAWERTASRPR